MRPAPALHNIIITAPALEIIIIIININIITIIISKHLLDFKTKQFENVSSPPLMLHAGGGGGAGDMPCLPHLVSTIQLLEYQMVWREGSAGW